MLKEFVKFLPRRSGGKAGPVVLVLFFLLLFGCSTGMQQVEMVIAPANKTEGKYFQLSGRW